MPPIGYVVFDDAGNAGIHCGENPEGKELVAWIGAPAVVEGSFDPETQEGTPAYHTTPQFPDKKKKK